MSTSLIFGNTAIRLMSQMMHAGIESKTSWGSSFGLSGQAMGELHFLRYNIRTLKFGTIDPKPAASRRAHSDANNTGYGGCVAHVQNEFAHSHWDHIEKNKSLT